VPVEFRGNTGAPVQLLFTGNGMTIEIDCSSTNTARLRSTLDDGFAKSTFVRSGENPGIDADGIVDAGDALQIADEYHHRSIDANFDFNNLVLLTTPMGGPAPMVIPSDEVAPPDGIYQGTFGHTTQTSTAQEVTGVYLASININTSPGNCVFIANLNRD
jgi:hypothetical protein